MLQFFVVGGMFFLLFWFSLRPGSTLGIGRIRETFPELDSKHLQTKSNLRLAGRKALAIYSLLLAIGVLTGLPNYSYPQGHAFPGLLGALCGLFFGYAFLHWSTRPAGWYGLD